MPCNVIPAVFHVVGRAIRKGCFQLTFYVVPQVIGRAPAPDFDPDDPKHLAPKVGFNLLQPLSTCPPLEEVYDVCAFEEPQLRRTPNLDPPASPPPHLVRVRHQSLRGSSSLLQGFLPPPEAFGHTPLGASPPGRAGHSRAGPSISSPVYDMRFGNASASGVVRPEPRAEEGMMEGFLYAATGRRAIMRDIWEFKRARPRSSYAEWLGQLDHVRCLS